MYLQILANKDYGNNNFLFLVSSIYEANGHDISKDELRDKIFRIRDSERFYRTSLIGRLDKIQARQIIGYKTGINHLHTYGVVGVVLMPPSDEHIKVAWNCDLGSPRDEAQLREYVREHSGKLKSPLTLLTDTPKIDGINELIVRGDENTSLDAVFYKSNDLWSISRARGLADLISEMTERNVPLLRLPVPSATSSLQKIDYPKMQGQFNSYLSEFMAA